MARDADRNGYSIPLPKTDDALPWVKSTYVQQTRSDPTNLGWRPKLPIPDTYSYFGHPDGRKNSKSENKQAPTLGNKWRRK
jgi:hypothetical protein